MAKLDTSQDTTDDQQDGNQRLPTWEKFGNKLSELLRGSQEMSRQEKREKESQQSPKSG